MILFFFFNDTATTEIYTLSLHDALPISKRTEGTKPSPRCQARSNIFIDPSISSSVRSEEHTSELQSPCNLVCRLLLEKKKKKDIQTRTTLKALKGTITNTHRATPQCCYL